MLIQAVQFVREKSSPSSGLKSDAKWEDGVAKVKAFGVGDVDWIVDVNGKLVKDVYNFRLVEAPLSHIDVNYR